MGVLSGQCSQLSSRGYFTHQSLSPLKFIPTHHPSTILGTRPRLVVIKGHCCHLNNLSTISVAHPLGNLRTCSFSSKTSKLPLPVLRSGKKSPALINIKLIMTAQLCWLLSLYPKALESYYARKNFTGALLYFPFLFFKNYLNKQLLCLECLHSVLNRLEQ